ncbi:DNA integrity scanning diadenylate cyclase DisA [Fusobacterium sp.]|uniref:DNA integrity scanning diadenylate cyclase DisA n=1 Tax=Fusobacterium sp. TaxID=68766 RepID=UPI002628F3E4|nr:DNA integrity scanning diadenylate cyclase DisA [Fusobacterium sp.]
MDRTEWERILSLVAPGSKLREGLDNILDGQKGALILVGIDEEVEKVLDGGFSLNCEYTPERLFELSKMDGAIILDDKIERILYANVHLQPDKRYLTDESGTRHRTAQRIAKQLDRITIAISERKRVQTLYKGEIRYKLRSLEGLMNEASQGINTLERYRYVLDKSLINLTLLELDGIATVEEVCIVLQKFEMFKRIKIDVIECLFELGSEGKLLRLQLEDLVFGLKDEKLEFLKDYYTGGEEKEEELAAEMSALDDSELLDLAKLSSVLGFGKTTKSLDNPVTTKGYRLLSKFGKLTRKDVGSLVDKFGQLSKIQEASVEELSEVISKFKANAVKRGFERVKFMSEIGKK